MHFLNPEKQLGQRTIAQEVTELVHGIEIRNRVETMIQVLYDQDFEQTTPEAIQEAFENDKRLIIVPKSFLEYEFIDLLIKANVFPSKCNYFVT
jgi:tyrosyl-tRNA synthetase